jgi:hypothetical protein
VRRDISTVLVIIQYMSVGTCFRRGGVSQKFRAKADIVEYRLWPGSGRVSHKARNFWLTLPRLKDIDTYMDHILTLTVEISRLTTSTAPVVHRNTPQITPNPPRAKHEMRHQSTFRSTSAHNRHQSCAHVPYDAPGATSRDPPPHTAPEVATSPPCCLRTAYALQDESGKLMSALRLSTRLKAWTSMAHTTVQLSIS